MALLTSEIRRIKYELGYNVLNVGAEPYVGVSALFEQVVQVYLTAGATTTSSTAVTAATAVTPVAITLTSATGVTAGDALVIDVDERQERATIQSLSGAIATVGLTLAHSGTYPVTVEGGEAIVRTILRRLVALEERRERSLGRAGIKKVDEVEFFEGGQTFKDFARERDSLRDDLAIALFGSGHRAGGSASISIY
jgi:hypothetical protein